MKKPIFALIMCAVLMAMACTTTDYTSNMAGASDYATVAVKDFVTLGIVTVHATETHYASAFGFKKSVEGAKITYSDLLQEAAKLEADDVINVRIDVNTTYQGTVFDWITGWKRVYTHTGTALAIKYTDKLDSQDADPQLNGIPKSPESTGVVKTSRSGRVQLP